MNLSLYIWQRATAALMAPMVLVHLAVIFYATRHGLTAADILGARARQLRLGRLLRPVRGRGIDPCRDRHPQHSREWSPLADRAAGIAAALFGLVLFGLGLRAVAAVALP